MNEININKKIFLVGFMGCGKSKMGKALASKLNKTFIDLDDLIVLKNQMSIPEMFANFGENGFREKEKGVLQQSAFAEDVVIATGGGAPCFFENMDWMNNNGLTIFIDTPVKVLADRLINARVERPLVKGKSYEELTTFIEMKLSERKPFYNKAQIILKGVDLNVETIVEALENI
ncbi:shikimate kinase [Pedobacter psychrophilus]|uniref:Shikimate kinase n=1 Tax=Pedobacter psychrophilus TaxID=1826909 RepID=A0A179DI37_9SPHI|nr:shikimate kinase [Pedobacter psychrophilus]OAQ40681.1 shikimate kinase [Pedobacter psychrophilus]